MQALKGLVIGLGILIVGVMTVLGYGLYRKASDPDFKFFALGGEPAGTTIDATINATTDTPINAPYNAPGTFGTTSLALPAGATIAATHVSGDRLIVHIRGTRPVDDHIVIIDIRSGQVLGNIEINGR